MSYHIKGNLIDDFTRCQHYHSSLDIVAIKFNCCDTHYACIHCHEELSDHKVKLWPKNEWNTKAVLCGQCKTEISIHEYLNCEYRCPKCKSNFNPKCSNHNHLYFDMAE